MKIAGYGLSLIISTFILFIGLLIITSIFPFLLLKVVTGFVAFISLFNLYFFRDPERKVVLDKNRILSPADGKVVLIRDVVENEFFKGPAILISIFLSVFNVHVNRHPIGGKVTFFRYKAGDFLAAFKEEASERNEQAIIGIEGEKGQVLFKQIAGLIARRVVCETKEGDEVNQGERMGMIRYGSRADVFVPVGSRVLVKTGDNVKGGLSVIGEFNG